MLHGLPSNTHQDSVKVAHTFLQGKGQPREGPSLRNKLQSLEFALLPPNEIFLVMKVLAHCNIRSLHKLILFSIRSQRRRRVFSRKTFRRRVLQKIVGVSHTTHIPHISSTFYISHTYPFQTYPPHISHTYPAHCTYPTHIHSKRIPHIRIPSVRIHAMRIHSKGCNTYPTNHHQYPIHIQHIIHIPHISSSNVSIPNVSHQYVSIANVSIQKVCISRNRKRIPPIHIPPIRIFNTYPTSTDPFNAYPFKKFASAGMALSMSITAYHFIPFIPLLLGGNGNEYKNLAFPSILCKIIN